MPSSGSKSSSGSGSSSSSGSGSSRSSASSSSSDASGKPGSKPPEDAGKAAAVALPPPPGRDAAKSEARADPVAAVKSEPETADPERTGKDAKQNGRAESPQTTRLHVGHLTRNVTDVHVREIFSNFGPLKSVELAIDKQVNLPRGFAYVEFQTHEDATKAQAHMNGGQLDGNTLSVQFLLLPRKRSPPPPPLRRHSPPPPPRGHSPPRRLPVRDDRPRHPRDWDRDPYRDRMMRRRDSPPRGYRREPSPRRRRPLSPPRRSRREPSPRRRSPPRRARLPSPPRSRGRRSPSPRRRRPSPPRRRSRSPVKREPERKPAAKRRSETPSSASSSSGGSSSSRSSSGSPSSSAS